MFRFYDRKWGAHTCDRFADNNNNKISKFNFRFWVPNTAGVDAIAFDWSTENNWLVPPIHLVGRDAKHMLHCEANETLVVPKWTSALF